MDNNKSWSRLAEHMDRYHPESKYFGDSIQFSLTTGQVFSHTCQICGEDLAQKPSDRKKETQWPVRDWWWNRSQTDDNHLCPCDNHPAEDCETCRGACSCHWQTQMGKNGD